MRSTRPQLQAYLDSLRLDHISHERKSILAPLISELVSRRQPDSNVPVHFICTHNSRRSQFAQVWAQVAAYYYSVQLESYSAGVEVTECNVRVLDALERAGLSVYKGDLTNAVHAVSYADDEPTISLYSKLYSDERLPQSGYIAVMVCAHADEHCPVLPGVTRRIAVRYSDPKVSDGTTDEASTYDERCRQIATEMMYVCREVVESCIAGRTS